MEQKTGRLQCKKRKKTTTEVGSARPECLGKSTV
jgi:hypothetical protein